MALLGIFDRACGWADTALGCACPDPDALYSRSRAARRSFADMAPARGLYQLIFCCRTRAIRSTSALLSASCMSLAWVWRASSKLRAASVIRLCTRAVICIPRVGEALRKGVATTMGAAGDAATNGDDEACGPDGAPRAMNGMLGPAPEVHGAAAATRGCALGSAPCASIGMLGGA